LGKNKDHEQLLALEDLVERGILDDVIGVIKSGKEATVYLCEGPLNPSGLVAAKVYRSRDVRRFANDALYMEGRTRGMRHRDARAIAQKSRAGREIAFGQWVSEEFDTLTRLKHEGCDVPEVYDRTDSIILMEYVGDDGGPAPALANVRLDRQDAHEVWQSLLRNVELMLRADRVHGDLSAFNVLYQQRRPVIIDFPQAVDARFNTSALELLERDIDRLASYFERYGIIVDAWRTARDLWARFLRSDL
jgi:RIO kinase 1